jgi:hypothetical protein
MTTYKNNADILTWKRVIENLQNKTDETVNEHEMGLLGKVARQMEADAHSGDYTAIEELLHNVSEEEMKAYLSDHRSPNEYPEEAVTEGTWSIPDTPEKVRELKDLMSKELPADEAQDKIYGILGDDELFDAIAEMEEKDPKADVRGMIVRRLDDLGLLKNKKVDEEKQRLDPECWDGYHKDGTKMKSGVRVNNCVKD